MILECEQAGQTHWAPQAEKETNFYDNAWTFNTSWNPRDPYQIGEKIRHRRLTENKNEAILVSMQSVAKQSGGVHHIKFHSNQRTNQQA